MKRQAIQFLRNYLPRHRKAPAIRFLKRLSQVTYHFIENENYDMSRNGEQRVLEVLAENGSIKTVFDVGANVGEYTIAAAQAFPQATVYAFEPVQKTFDRLTEQTIGLSRALRFNYGLSDRDETVTFSVREDDSGNSTAHPSISELLNPGVIRNSERCRLRHAGSAVADLGIDQIDLLKIDTEGNDWFVLNGLSDWLASGRIRVIQFEYGLSCISTKRLLFDHYELLSKHDYHVGKIFPTHVDFKDYHPLDEDFIGPNFLAVHESTGLKQFLQ